MKRLGALLLVALLAALPRTAAADLTPGNDGVRSPAQVRSLQEIRFARVVQQKWDQSCASAALSTLLTYYLDNPTDETAIISDMVRYGDPLQVRQRGGFSLLDLKRYAQRHDYVSQGYGRLTLLELAEFKTPAIVPIRVRGYDHFVLFITLVGDRVVLADPAFGNLTLTARQFERVWQNGIAFLVFKGAIQPAEKAPEPDPNLPVSQPHNVERALRGMGPVPPTSAGR